MVESSELRLYCLVRCDIEIPVGKLLAQAGHAYCETLEKSRLLWGDDLVRSYFKNNQPKISIRTKNLAALERAARECLEADIVHAVITDAGRTVFTEPTITCMGIGPIQAEELPKYIQRMQLY